MEEAGDTEEPSIGSEFARTIKYIDLYLMQKIDLFLQNYVFDPFDVLIKRIMYLSVIVTLLAAGTLILLMGVVLFVSTLIPLWTALLITGAAILIAGGVIAYLLVRKKIVLNTPVATEMMRSGKT